MRFRRVTLYCCLLASIYMLSLVSPAFCHSRQEAEDMIKDAESEVSRCYIAAFEAEKAGANVSELLATLNEAGWLLSRAKLAYNNGDYDSTVELVNQSIIVLEGFVENANALMEDAEKARSFDFASNFVGSAVGAVAVMICGYAIWFYLKSEKNR